MVGTIPNSWNVCPMTREWAAQRRIESGELMDFFPYPESLRFRNREAAVG